ncbi:hypothetical protein ACK1X7_01375 [Streptomyces sp. CY1]|uniref:hypothetical protein n=1 Tax=Streptomyces sp. CY1 TaxID=3388313 RepID=UPI0039A15A34
MVRTGALRTARVSPPAEDAQKAGASAVLLAPLTYQARTDDEVFGLYEDVSRELPSPRRHPLPVRRGFCPDWRCRHRP